jgi:hypothetical protein
MRPTLTIAVEDTIERAVREFHRNGCAVLPVLAEGKLVGVISETCLMKAVADDIDLRTSCAEAMHPAQTIHSYASGSEALRLFSESTVQTFVVTDDHDHVMGVISPSDLMPRRRMLLRPPMVGGMATPFGVYLTNGSLHGGVGLFSVMATGILMLGMFIASIAVTHPITNPILQIPMPEFIKALLVQAIPMVAFMAILRLIPLSGTHGAEHMVVHAIERGEELTPEVVSRMPRVHPRCGTNIAVAMVVFLAIFRSTWYSDEDVRLLVAVIITMFSWRPLGSFVQQYVTTRKPNSAQLRSGIKAGNELIQRYSTAHSTSTSVPVRIWNSGMVHVMSGGLLTVLVLKGLMMWFHFAIPGIE